MRPAILEIVKSVAPTPPQEPIADDVSLVDSGFLDSFALPTLVAALEQRFDIKIPDSDLSIDNFDTIAKISAYVASRKK